MKNKTHYRRVMKSDHLGVADLEDLIEDKKSLIFTIKEVRQEMNVAVAGKKGNFNIAYFKEDIKPLVLNATNARVLRMFAKNSPFVEDWSNIAIELYINESVKMKGELVGGVRIKTKQPKKDDLPVISEIGFEKAIKAIKNKTYKKEDLPKTYSLTKEQKTILDGIV